MNAALLLALLAAEQCSGGPCGARLSFPLTLDPVQIAAPAPTAKDGWHQFGPDEWHLWRRGEQIGGYRPSDDTYRPYLRGAWGNPQVPPVAPPAAAKTGAPAGALQHWQTHGVEAGKIAEERHTLTGKEVSKTKMLEAIGSGVPDDSKHKRLAIFAADPAERKRLADEAASVVQAEGLADRITVTAHDPAKWQAKDNGFVTETPVSVYLEEADGQMRGRESAAWPNREVLAGALRRVRPDYKPDKDGTIWTPKPLGADDDTLWLVAGGAAVVLLLLLRK